MAETKPFKYNTMQRWACADAVRSCPPCRSRPATCPKEWGTRGQAQSVAATVTRASHGAHNVAPPPLPPVKAKCQRQAGVANREACLDNGKAGAKDEPAGASAKPRASAVIGPTHGHTHVGHAAHAELPADAALGQGWLAAVGPPTTPSRGPLRRTTVVFRAAATTWPTASSSLAPPSHSKRGRRPTGRSCQRCSPGHVMDRVQARQQHAPHHRWVAQQRHRQATEGRHCLMARRDWLQRVHGNVHEQVARRLVRHRAHTVEGQVPERRPGGSRLCHEPAHATVCEPSDSRHSRSLGQSQPRSQTPTDTASSNRSDAPE